MRRLRSMTGGLCLLSLLFLFLVPCRHIEAAPKARLTVSWWQDAGKDEAFETVASLFTATYPDTTIELMSMPFAEYEAKMKVLIASGLTPDVMNIMPEFGRSFYKSGAIVNITPYAEKDNLLKDVFPFVLNSFSGGVFNGELYGMGLGLQTWGLYYNRAIFDRAGLPYPDDWTWDDLIKRAKVLARDIDGDGVLDQHPLRITWNYQMAIVLTGSYGGFLFNQDFSKTGLHLPGTSQGLTVLQDMMHIHEIALKPGSPATIAFESQNLAMRVAGSFLIPAFMNPDLGLDFGYAYIPRGTHRLTVGSGGGLAISAISPHPDLAWKFIKMATTSAEGVNEFTVKNQVNIPVLRSWALSNRFLSSPSAHQHNIRRVEQLAWARDPAIFHDKAEEIRQVLDPALNKFMRNAGPTQWFLDQVGDQLRRLVEG